MSDDNIYDCPITLYKIPEDEYRALMANAESWNKLKKLHIDSLFVNQAVLAHAIKICESEG